MMLAGLKVLDLSRLLPGPYATLVLADLGAQVDKLESPEGGDFTRHTPPMRGEKGALFEALNRNKRTLTLNLKTPAGVAALKRLAKHYDVLVETFRPGVMGKLGVGFEALERENPALIYCSISGYGATGPDRLKAGHDINYVSRAGLAGYAGVAGGAPNMPGAQIADIGGSLFSVIGILSALHERHRTGRGRFVDISLTESALAFLHMQLGARVFMGPEGTALERGREPLNGGFPCYGLYETEDSKWLSVGALEPKFFQGVCEVLGRPELLEGAYDLGAGSVKVRRELEAIFAQKSRAEWLAIFEPHDVCVEAVHEGDDVLSDRQLRDRGAFVEQGGQTYVRTSAGDNDVAIVPGRELGADTETVLREAGFTSEQISELRV